MRTRHTWIPFSLDHEHEGIFWTRKMWERFIRAQVKLVNKIDYTTESAVEGFKRARWFENIRDQYPFFTFIVLIFGPWQFLPRIFIEL